MDVKGGATPHLALKAFLTSLCHIFPIPFPHLRDTFSPAEPSSISLVM